VLCLQPVERHGLFLSRQRVVEALGEGQEVVYVLPDGCLPLGRVALFRRIFAQSFQHPIPHRFAALVGLNEGPLPQLRQKHDRERLFAHGFRGFQCPAAAKHGELAKEVL
jgi:hypothetical protein